MPPITTNDNSLLEKVRQMSVQEFDAFLQLAISERQPSKSATLSAKETKLLQQINRGLPTDLSRRFSLLIRRRKREQLTPEEHHELLTLTDKVETCDAERAAALLALARLRRVPLRTLMRQMGIGMPASHG